MNSPVLVPIVEGHAEVQSVPVLLRRLLSQRNRYDVKIARPIRVGRYKVVRPGELERACELARRRPEGCDAILLLLDADDDCPKEIAPALLERGRRASAGLPFAVVLAKSELEAWFLGSLESLRGMRGLVDTAESPPRPEDIRDAKGYLSHWMTGQRSYVEVDDQASLADRFDLQLAQQRFVLPLISLSVTLRQFLMRCRGEVQFEERSRFADCQVRRRGLGKLIEQPARAAAPTWSGWAARPVPPARGRRWGVDLPR